MPKPTIYRGWTAQDDDPPRAYTFVTVETPLGSISPLKHEVRHSPTGFSWGYAGSGPSDLARSILADHLGYVPPPVVYQRFKEAYVAQWPQDEPWELTSTVITLWLDLHVSRCPQCHRVQDQVYLTCCQGCERVSIAAEAAAHDA